MGFQLAQSDLILDDLEGSKFKVTVFVLKYVGITLGHIDSSSLDLCQKSSAFLLDLLCNKCSHIQHIPIHSHLGHIDSSSLDLLLKIWPSC